MASSLSELRAKLAAQQARLETVGGGRAKRNVYAKLGALKRKLEAAEQAGGAAAAGAAAPTQAGAREAGGDAKRARRTRHQAARKGTKSRAKLIALNADIATAAKRKQLRAAVKSFAAIERHGLAPDVHSYGNLINAHVRCADVAGAQRVMADMRGAGVKPSVVAYTVLLKGLCEAGDIEGASQCMRDLLDADLKPNVRTVNTYLRGCVRAGAIDEAAAMLKRMRPDWNAAPDASSYECVVGLLCQGLRLPAARKVVSAAAQEDAAEGGGVAAGAAATVAENPALYSHLAGAAALLGEWAECRQWLRCAADALKMSKGAHLKHTMEARAAAAAAAERARKHDNYGNAADTSEERSSIALFLQHRREEIEREVDAIRAFVRAHSDTAQEDDEGDGEENGARAAGGEWGPAQLRDALLKVFWFDNAPAADAGADEESGKAVAEALLGAACSRFGLDRCLVRMAQPKRAMVDAAAAFGRAVTAGGHVRFAELFEQPELPLKLELCSGTGDWVVEQALADDGRANWVALELRCDRVHSALTRTVFKGADNLALVGGDAARIVKRRFAPGSVSQVLVNHPEPPERTGAAPGSQGSHLLTTRFLKDVAVVLKPGGTLCIVTDNLAYGRQLTREVPLRFFDDGDLSEDAQRAVEVAGGADILQLWRGNPGPECGHAATDASSYFDRLWSRGSRTRRYFVFAVRKEDRRRAFDQDENEDSQDGEEEKDDDVDGESDGGEGEGEGESEGDDDDDEDIGEGAEDDYS